MCDRICKTCGGDDEVAKIAERMGFRPDIAFAKIAKHERTIHELQDFVIWMTGCGYDFTQHEYFREQRDKLIKEVCKNAP